MTATARSVIERIDAMRVDPDGPSQQEGEQIAALFDGNSSLFIELDERPYGHEHVSPPGGVKASGYGPHGGLAWHIALRRARNSCKRFFDVLAGEAPTTNPKED